MRAPARPHSHPPPASQVHQVWLARLLLLVGIICLGFVASSLLDARWFEWVEGRRFAQALARHGEAGARGGASPPQASGPSRRPASETDAIDTFRTSAPGPTPGEGAVLGRIEIPRHGISALLLQGIEPHTLRHGAGHIPDTAMPGQAGNVGVAAHRDSVFRGLKDIAHGDTVRLTTLDGVYEYQVDWTRIVNPNDVAMLDPSPQPELTLVTCYPFYYVGSAPQRFIVRAHRAEAGASGAGGAAHR